MNVQLHVALVTPWNKKGGIADYSERLVSALREEGITVTPVPLRHERTPNPYRFVRVLGDIPQDADVIHTQFEAGVFGRLGVSGVGAPLYFHRIGRLSTPSVTTLHEVHETHPHLPLPGDLLLRIRDTVIERLAIANSEAVVVHTHHALDVLRMRHGSELPIERLLHPAETDAAPIPRGEAKEHLGYDGPLVVTFGWVEEKKRYGEVCDALESLPEMSYLIAGEPRTEEDESYLDRVLARAERAGIADRVEHVGYVPESDISTVLSAADAVVLPYNRVSQSGAVNVALAYHCPVIASDLQAFAELRDEFDCLLTYEDTQELAAHLKAVTSESTVSDRLRAGAEEYAKTVTWDRFAERTIAIYSRLTSTDEGKSG